MRLRCSNTEKIEHSTINGEELNSREDLYVGEQLELKPFGVTSVLVHLLNGTVRSFR